MRPASLSVPANYTYISTSRSTSSLRPSPRRSLMVNAPPISPSLPSPCPKCRRPKSMPRANRLGMATGIQVLVLIFGVISTVLILFKSYFEYDKRTGLSYEMVHAIHLPNQPSAVLGEVDGKTKWTIWIPPSAPFPLRSWQYEELCAQADDIMRDVHHRKSFFATEPKFLDVEEAFRSDMLRSKKNEPLQGNTCKTSLTYIMESDDAGMGNSLLSLWLAYGIAQKEGRAFFVDDKRWAYGNYSSYFRPPPDPGCRPAPSTHRLPCPRSASHTVVSATTLLNALLPDFKEQSSSHQHEIYNLMHSGYQALFHLADQGDDAYFYGRINGRVFGEVKTSGGTTVGLHIRHGDVHPEEKMFEGDYLPLTRYMEEAHNILTQKYAANGMSEGSVFETYSTLFSPLMGSKQDLKRDLSTSMAASRVFLASDDPLVFSAPELSGTMRAQDRFHLATKADLEKLTRDSKPHSPLDAPHGWDGGFYRSVFLALGQPYHKTVTPPQHAHLFGSNVESDEHRRISKAALHAAATTGLAAGRPWQTLSSLEPPSKDAEAIRTLIGRGYLLDLAVLGQCDAIICGVNSAACRILGIMAGWDKIKGGMWRNIDGHGGWIGLSSSGKKW